MDTYLPVTQRYDSMPYRRSGKSGLKLPPVSLGLWHNFGGVDSFKNARVMCRTAFDLGITHFDLANNYGPPPGSAEENFGRILRKDFRDHRDELIISTKAGWTMWPGPYGVRCSLKSMTASLDQSLRRMRLDYVDIYYAHRWDEETPIEETMSALARAVNAGKALYVGFSSYSPEQTVHAASVLRGMGVVPVIHQPKYNMFERTVEKGLLGALENEGMGCIPFSPLAQGLLTDRYLNGLPADSRAVKSGESLNPGNITDEKLATVRALNDLARQRGQTLAQMALAWCLRHGPMVSVLIGASRPQQITDCAGALGNLSFDAEELARIDQLAPVT